MHIIAASYSNRFGIFWLLTIVDLLMMLENFVKTSQNGGEKWRFTMVESI